MTKNSRLQLISLILAFIWVLAPILIMILNAADVFAFDTYRIWITLLYVPGGLGIILGGFYLFNYKREKGINNRDLLKELLPLLIFFIFGIWALISSLASQFPLLALFGFVPMSDSMSVLLAYLGMMFLGLIIASDKSKIKLLAQVFLAMSSLLAIIAIINNNFTALVNTNEITNCFEYQSVFYNTNHYGYYIAVSLIVNAYLLTYAKSKIEKIIYVLTFILLTNILALNDTLGGFVAVFIALVFAIIWAFINKENKKAPLLIFGLFFATSLLTCLYTSNILSSVVTMFTDFGSIVDSEASAEEINAVGSDRGAMWKIAILFIRLDPIIGWGPQNVGFSAHNMFLQIAMYVGIPGLILYLAFLISGVVKLIKVRKTISAPAKAAGFAVVAYLISGFFGVTVFYTAPYFYILLGVCLSECLRKE